MAKADKKPKQEKKADGKILVCQNRKARHDYAIGERLEAGLVLFGTEVKACREGKAQLNDAYVSIDRGEAFLKNSHIAEYKYGGLLNHVPLRTRKLLLHKKEIEKLEVGLRQKGQVAIPLSMYFKDGRVKVDIGIGTGKTHEDRREDIKERDSRREMDRVMRRRR